MSTKNRLLHIWRTVSVLAIAILAVLCAGCTGSGTDSGGSTASQKGYFVYTANFGSNDVSEFAADGDGTLYSLGKVAAGGGPISVVGDDYHVYVANSKDNTISLYSIDGIGRLVSKGTVPVASTPTSLYVDAVGGPIVQRLYCTCGGTKQLVVFEIKQNPFSLTEVGRFPTGASPAKVTHMFDAYVANLGGKSLSRYRATSDGVLPRSPATIAVGSGPSKMDSVDGNLYVVNNFDASITELHEEVSDKFGVAPTLTVTGTVKTGSQPYAAALVGNGKVGSALFVSNRGSATITRFAQDETPLEKLTRGKDTPSGALVNDLKSTYALSPGLSVLYELDDNGDLRAYYEESDQSLKLFGTFKTNGTKSSEIYITHSAGQVLNQPPLEITPSTLEAGLVGIPYSQFVNPPGNWSIVSGALPDGLALLAKPETGDSVVIDELIAGTPTKAGTFTFTLKCDQGIRSATKSYTVTVKSPGAVVSAEYFSGLQETTNGNTDIEIGGIDLGNVVLDSVSKMRTISTGPQSLVVHDGGTKASPVLKSFSVTPAAGKRWVYVGVGDKADGYDVIQDSFDIGAKPPTGSAWITLYHGIKGLTETTDFYVVPTGMNLANTPYKKLGVAPLSAMQTFVIPVSGTKLDFDLIATEPGSPTSIIAQTKHSVRPGESQLDALISPPNIQATFYAADETLP